MDTLVVLGQAMCFCGLVYGCYVSIRNWHLSDKAGIEREFRQNPPGTRLTDRYDPVSDAGIASHIGLTS